MTRRHRVATTVAALAPFCGNALADASASGSITQIGFLLIDLTPDDGLAPWVTFNPLALDSHVSSEAATRTSGWTYDSDTGLGPFGAAATHVSPDAFVSASAEIQGDLFAGSLGIQSAASVLPAGRSLASAGGTIGGYATPEMMTITLSPGAAFELHAVGDLTVTTTAVADESEIAWSRLYIDLIGTTQYGDGSSIKVANGDFTQSLHRDLEVRFPNLTNAPTKVLIFVNQGSLVESVSLTSTVPEPAPFALMLAGLVGLGAMGTARARNVPSRKHGPP